MQRLFVCLPEKDTVQINRRNMNWLPAVVLTVLIVFGIILGSLFEFPTIDVRCGSREEVEDAGI
jgi:hypothetical protein